MTAQKATETKLELSAWTALWPLGLATALSLMGDATLYVVLPTHPGDAGIALGSVGLILSINRFVRLLSNGPAGWLFDRLPDRRMLFLGSLWLGVFSTLIYASSPGLELLSLARLLWGIAWSGIWIGGNAVVLEMAPADRRGGWVGVYQVWFFFGSALGSFLGGALTDAVGYRSALGIGAVVSAAGTVAAMTALLNSRANTSMSGAHASISGAHASMPGTHVRMNAPFQSDGESEKSRTSRQWRWSSFLPNWGPISPALGATCAAFAVNRLVAAGVVSATLGLLVEQNLPADLQWGTWQIGVASVTGGMVAARILISLVGAPFAGIWSDAAGDRWNVLVWSLIAGAIGMGLLAVPGGLPLILGSTLGAAASGSIQALGTTLAGDLAGEKQRGRNLGMLYTAGDLGSAIGPLAAYAMLPFTGLAVVFILSGLLMLGVGGWAAMVQWSSRRLAH